MAIFAFLLVSELFHLYILHYDAESLCNVLNF